MAKKKESEIKRTTKAIRLDIKLLNQLEGDKEKFGTWNDTLKHYLVKALNFRNPKWVLPSDIHKTKSQAKGEALKRVVKTGADLDQCEEPVCIGVVDE